MNGNTKLTTAQGYDVNRMVFSKPDNSTVPGSGISYKRINIGTVNEDGSTGDLVLDCGRRFSFGVSENINKETGKVNGYTMPLCLWTKDAPTEEEKAWTDVFDKIVEKCKDHLMDVKDSLGKYDLERIELKKLNPLYWKRVQGKIVDGQGPVLYAKLIESKKNNKILTVIVDESTGEELDPLSLIGKYCYAHAAVKIESIFIGAKIVLQVKLYEASVQLAQSGPKRLLARPTPVAQVSASSSSSNPMNDSDETPKAPARPAPQPTKQPVRQDEDEDIPDEDDDDTPPPPKPVSTARKVVPPAKKK